MRIIRIMATDFDGMENRASEAERTKELVVFVNENAVLLREQVDRFLENYKAPQSYLGWNDKVYPRLHVERSETP